MRVFLTLALALTYGSGVFAQAPRTTGQPAAQTTPAPTVTGLETDARQVREQLESLLMKYPPEVGRILKMDPTMLSNQQYLTQYPAIQAFMNGHPEIARNPTFYLESVRMSYRLHASRGSSEPGHRRMAKPAGVVQRVRHRRVHLLRAGVADQDLAQPSTLAAPQ